MNKKIMATKDAIKYNKDCPDFKCLEDGTITKECRYCNFSKACRQVGMVNGKLVPMLSNYCPVVNSETNEIIEWEYYCTGMYDVRSKNERIDDDKV